MMEPRTLFDSVPETPVKMVLRKPEAKPSVYRAPLYWILGVSLIFLVNMAVYVGLASPPSVALLVVSNLLILSLWSSYCAYVFSQDVYKQAIRTLQPTIASANQVSLDQVLTVLCDPNLWLTYVAGVWMLPMTLYNLPTNSEQRAQVLQAAGVSISEDILVTAGGWQQLLPPRVQRWLHHVVEHSDTKMAPEATTELERSFETVSDNSSTDLEPLVEVSSPYSISPVYSLPHPPAPAPDTDDEPPQPEAIRLPTVPLSAPNNDPILMLWNILVQTLKSKVLAHVEQNSSSTTLALTGVLAGTGLLVTQLRYSRTARHLLQTLGHVGVASVSTATVLMSLATLVSRYGKGSLVRLVFWHFQQRRRRIRLCGQHDA